MKEMYDNTQKYYVNHSYMISMNGDPDKWTNFMHVFNTFLNFYWTDFFGGGYWAQDPFLADDVRDVQAKFIELVNQPEDKMSIGILTFVEGIKPAPHWNRGGVYVYPNLMTYYEKGDDKYGYHPKQIFGKMMELLKHDSIQEVARQSFKEAGLPYMIINNTGD